MIPKAYLNEWRQVVPWSQDEMIEQDLVISRLLVELFNHPHITNAVAFRGGTALYKLFSVDPIRYSEDIDLVQINAEPIGETITAIRSVVDPLLGSPLRKRSKNLFTLTYEIQTKNSATLQKLKIEINTREHFSVFGWRQKEFIVNSSWYSGNTQIQSYQYDELLGTKIRAFYERDKGRDLFDIWYALQQDHFNPKRAVKAFLEYTNRQNKSITRAMFEKNFSEKLDSGLFTQDISPLLAPTITWDFEKATVEVFEKIITLIPGNRWKNTK